MNKLMKDMKFDEILNIRVDMENVDLTSVKPWISKRITELIKDEDEVLIDYIYNQLEPKFPDPKEIQTNLSGFLSYKNSRIFTSELWRQLLDSLESSEVGKSENQKIHNDKIKSFPKLGPTENKNASKNVSYPKKSKDKNENQPKKLTGSPSYSFPSRYNSRSRSRSRGYYKYRNYQKHRHSRSRTKSSSRYTPYTRYSRYTESYEMSSSSCSSSQSHSKRTSFSSNSFSSNRKSGILSNVDILNSKKDLNGVCLSTNSQSSVQRSVIKASNPVNKEHNDDFKISLLDDKYLSKSEQNNSTDFSASPVKYIMSNQNSDSSTSCSASIAFVSPQNLHRHRKYLSSNDSSSDYSIEYVDQNLFLHQCRHNNSETGEESDIEWMTIEEYRNFKENEINNSNSSSSTSSNCSSEYSFGDIEWVENYQLHNLPDDYLRI